MIGPRIRHLPSALIAMAALLGLAVLVGWLARGGTGAGGAAAGVGLVAASYVGSTLILAWADSVSPQLVLPVGLMTYVLKFLTIGIVMAAIAATGWAGLPAMGVALIAAVLVWTATQATWVWRARIPYVEIDSK